MEIDKIEDKFDELESAISEIKYITQSLREMVETVADAIIETTRYKNINSETLKRVEKISRWQ
ncbi:MAG: hypothetical protein UR20_C0054G0004 [Candidatus Woesebacteria bacterium GW2011_GWE2_31_6]|nr:MAG: hypothetical protein UR20_C0054G0004 [Candidatus Woesebacteria bacterium GW2011_GWE2_31_6]